jgi:hypothetical protein
MYPRWDIKNFEFYKRLNEVMIENKLFQGLRIKIQKITQESIIKIIR